MEPEMMFRIAAIVVASFLLLSGANYQPMLSWVKSLFNKKNVVPSHSNVNFLDVVSSWHKVKEQCVELGLNEAAEKLDEVFPLLNSED